MKRTIFATFMLVALTFSSKAYDFMSGDLCYNITGNYTVEVTYEKERSIENYKGMITATIPNSVINGRITYSVTGIGKDAFASCTDLKTVYIPSSVTNIDVFAFNFTTSYYYAPKLKTIIVDTNNVNYVSKEGVLFDKEEKTLICCPRAKRGHYIIPSTVISIGDYSFSECVRLDSITIPTSVTSIGSVTIPNSVTSIGDGAFGSCGKLPSINVDSDNSKFSSVDGVLFNKDKTTLVCYPAGKIGSSYIIPSSVTSIGGWAFYGCSGLTSVTIPNSVTSIGDRAFRGCSGLTSVTIPNSVTSIGDYAFMDCSGLTSVTIPNSVTSIGSSAFAYCSGLTSVTIPNSVKSIGNGAFGSCGKLPSINVDSDNSKFSSVDGVLFNKDKTTLVCYPAGKIGSSYIIPSSVTSIGGWAFYGCSGLTSVTIPNSVTSIGNYAFEGCSGLTSVTIPNSVTSIGDAAFYGCSKVTIYCQAAKKPSGWKSNWNPRNRPVKWGCKAVNLSANDDSFGTVSGGGLFVSNTSVTISATPAKNYHFVEWSDGNKTATRTFNVTEDIDLIAEFAIDTYTLALSGTNGTVSGAGTYDYGTSVKISATPNTGYHFTKWNDGNETATRTINVTSNIDLEAIFTINTYTVELSCGNGTVEGAGTYEHGAEATISATPNDNYHFVGWSDKNTDNPRTITVVSDTAFVANFAIDTYTVTLSGDNGSIEGAGTYNYGAEVTLIATPNDNYHFVGWGDDNNENPRTITIVSDTTLTAVFAIDTFKVTAYTENGTVSGVGAYPYGTSASLTATPAEHYHFAKWNDGNTENPRSIKVTSDTTLIAVFAIDTLKVTAFAENGTVSGAGLYAYGTQTSLSATPAEHYHFAKWSDGNTENPRSITVTEDITLVAVFAIDTLKVNTFAENGTVSGTGAYTYGTQTSLTATPAEHYHFTRWSDGNTENPRSITVTTDMAFTAMFAIDTLKVTASAENGTVSGAGLYAYGTETILTATSAEHYHFAKWSDGNIDNPRTITVTSDTTLTAMFGIDTLKLEVNAENGTVSGAGEYAYGAETSLTATPAEHYHFAKWSDGNTENPRLVTVASDTILTAEFAIDTLKVTITAQNGTVEGAGEYAYGTNITLTATPVENYKFSRWSDGNTDNPRTITVTEDITLEAIFEKADAISANAVNAVNIYAHHNTIVVENANADIFVYDATGRLIARRDVACHVSITMPQQGIYIVKVGNDAKRVIVGY